MPTPRNPQPITLAAVVTFTLLSVFAACLGMPQALTATVGRMEGDIDRVSGVPLQYDSSGWYGELGVLMPFLYRDLTSQPVDPIVHELMIELAVLKVAQAKQVEPIEPQQQEEPPPPDLKWWQDLGLREWITGLVLLIMTGGGVYGAKRYRAAKS